MAPPAALSHLHPSAIDTTALARIEAQSQLPSLVELFSPSGGFAPSTRRLVVLIPDADADESELAEHLWSIASVHGLAVLLIGIFSDERWEPRTRRRLATLAALLRDEVVLVETKLETDTDWLTAIRSIRQPGDILLCHAELHDLRWGFRRESLSRRLAREFNEPVYELSGFYPHLPSERSRLVSRAIAFGGSVLIVVLFTALEILIHQTTQAPVYTLLMSLCVLVEYGLLGVWACQLN